MYAIRSYYVSGVEIERLDDTDSNPTPVVVTWTVTDVGGNTSTCSFNLTIIDNEGPKIIVPGNAIRYTDAATYANYYTVQGTEFDDVTATDNCGIVVKIENEYNATTLAGIQLPVGYDDITWYAEDDKGNSSTEDFHVTVLDNLSPRVKTEPTGISVSAGENCQTVVNYVSPVFEDNVTGVAPNVGALTITVSPEWATPGATFPVGNTAVTYLVVDEAGNEFSYTFDITVTDDTLPVVTCPVGSPFAVNTEEGEAYYLVDGTEFNPTYSDNCVVTLTNSFNNTASLASAQLPVGTHPITWTAKDASGNESSCEITVVVTDEEDPEIQVCPDATVSKNADFGYCRYRIPGADYDPFGFSDNDVLQKITYSINGADEVGGDLSTSLQGVDIPVGENTIIWKLYDVSGNSAECTITFTVTDTQAPVITTIANQVRSTTANSSTYTILAEDNFNPTITDNCEVQTITYKINSEDPVGSGTATTIVGQALPIGTNTIMWTATDIHGNSSTKSYQVTVSDNEPPTVVCNDITVQLASDGTYTLTQDNINAIGAGSTDVSGPLTFSVAPSSFDCADVGANTVTLTVTDAYNNSATCDATVTVQDVIPPTAVCKTVTLYLDVLGSATLSATTINNGSSDICGIASYLISKEETGTYSPTLDYNCSEAGTPTVYLKVTDKNGNSSICNTAITVKDENNPIAVCNPITVALDASGHYTLRNNFV